MRFSFELTHTQKRRNFLSHVSTNIPSQQRSIFYFLRNNFHEIFLLTLARNRKPWRCCLLVHGIEFGVNGKAKKVRTIILDVLKHNRQVLERGIIARGGERRRTFSTQLEIMASLIRISRKFVRSCSKISRIVDNPFTALRVQWRGALQAKQPD